MTKSVNRMRALAALLAIMLGGGAQAVDVQACGTPEWPAATEPMHFGTTTLQYQLDADGAVRGARVSKSSGFPMLDAAALKPLIECKASKLTSTNPSVDGWYSVNIVWPAPNNRPDAQMGTLEENLLAGKRGEPVAEYALAMRYFTGAGVEPDLAEGRRWLQLAAQHGHAQAKRALGERQPGAAPYFADTLYALRQAAKKESAQAQAILATELPRVRDDYPALQPEKYGATAEMDAEYKLALKYIKGVVLERNPAEAMSLLRKSATSGYLPSQELLADRYYNGLDIPVNMPEAVRWYRLAAAQGSVTSMTQLGWLLVGPLYPEVAKDRAEALGWLRKAAQSGSAWGQYAFARLLMRENPSASETAEAIKALQSAATQEQADAIGQLAQCYAIGRGVPQDDRKALALYQRGAAKHDLRSLLALAKMYESGQGLPADLAKAKEMRQTAARTLILRPEAPLCPQ